MRWRSGISAHLILAGLVLASALGAIEIAWSAFGRQIDEYAYDFLFRLEPPRAWQPQSIILAIDEPTLTKYGGLIGMRAALAHGLERIAPAHPAAVAVDIILAEPGQADPQLESAFRRARNLILSCDLVPDGSHWEDPIPEFRRHAGEVGEVHADLDKYDAVNRSLPLEMADSGNRRRWALALQTFAAVKGSYIVESPEDLRVGGIAIPSAFSAGRTMRIRYLPPSTGAVPRVSIAALDAHPELASRFAGKVVFAGVTAQTVSDRWMTPYSNGIAMPGIEMHANAYETIAQGHFLVDAPLVDVVLATLLFAISAGLAYALWSGWAANMATLVVIASSQALPALAFAHSTVWPWVPGAAAALIATGSGAAWRHLLVRRELTIAENEKARYQQTIHFVTHEMRTPLTAIQGSSELIGRYTGMPEAKRKQIADLIHAESKRLARMISTFLTVERLSDGQMELKQERFPLCEVVEGCVLRARPLADNKQIEIDVLEMPPDELVGDRELMEYAVYNLLTNAVKYSPPNTRVTVFGENNKSGRMSLSVQDQGIGMDRKEVGRIFERFYRTRRAEESGEVGTGIGLSIVEQIVTRHGGAIHVESEPGKGSKFTLVLRRAA